jgi:hypothetical protein
MAVSIATYTGPVSRPSSICWVQTPVTASPAQTDQWIGADIEVFAMKVDFQGRMVDGLRVRVPRQAPARASVAPNARARAEQPAMAEAGGYADLNDDLDEVPF